MSHWNDVSLLHSISWVLDILYSFTQQYRAIHNKYTKLNCQQRCDAGLSALFYCSTIIRWQLIDFSFLRRNETLPKKLNSELITTKHQHTMWIYLVRLALNSIYSWRCFVCSPCHDGCTQFFFGISSNDKLWLITHKFSVIIRIIKNNKYWRFTTEQQMSTTLCHISCVQISRCDVSVCKPSTAMHHDKQLTEATDLTRELGEHNTQQHCLMYVVDKYVVEWHVCRIGSIRYIYIQIEI